MKIAIPIWQGRISPVFDVAGQLLLVDFADHHEVARTEQHLEEGNPNIRAKRLAELGVGTLICASISYPLEAALSDIGISIIAQVCGDVEEVLTAFIAGKLGDERFVMPGCCGRRRQRRQGNCARNRLNNN